MSDPSTPSRPFQFRLATLLLLTGYAALVCLGLRSPIPLWAGVISILTLLTIFAAIVVAIYCSGRPRTMAIGYLLFYIGYLIHLSVLANLLSVRLDNGTTTL